MTNAKYEVDTCSCRLSKLSFHYRGYYNDTIKDENRAVRRFTNVKYEIAEDF